MSVDVHHVVEGPADAPILAFSNSLGSSLAMWDPQVPRLSERFRVVRYDLRGHGRSPVPPGPYDVDALGGDLVALLDRLAIERANLCGISLGGLVSMWVASHAPERVDRLVLCCTSATFAPAEPWRERAALVRARGMDAVADVVVGRWFTPGFAAAHPDVVRRMRDMIASTPPAGYADCCEAVGEADLRPALGAIRAPTLVIGGAEDPAVTRERTEELAHGIVNAYLEFVPAAHLATVEQPERVTDLIAEHMARALGDGSEGAR